MNQLIVRNPVLPSRKSHQGARRRHIPEEPAFDLRPPQTGQLDEERPPLDGVIRHVQGAAVQPNPSFITGSQPGDTTQRQACLRHE